MPRPYDVLDALEQLYNKKFGWYGKVPPPKGLAKAIKSGKWADGTKLSKADIRAANCIVEAMTRKPEPNACPGCGGLMRDGACVPHITELCPPVGVRLGRP